MDIGQALSRITEISEQLFGAFEPQHVYNRIVQIALAELQADCASLILRDEETHEISIPAVVGMARAAPGESPAWAPGRLADWVLKQRGPVILPGDDDRMPGMDGLLCGERAHTAACAPMLVRDRSIGVLTVARQQGRLPFTTADLELLLLIAGQGALAIESAQRYQCAERRASRMSSLNELGTALAAPLDLDSALQVAAEQLGALLPGTYGYLVWRGDEQPPQARHFAIGDAAPLSAGDLRAVGGLAGRVLETGVPQLVPGAEAGPLAPWERLLIREETQTLLGSALAIDQSVAGVIVLASPPGAPFGEADLTFLNAAAALVARSTGRARAYERMALSAAHYRALLDHARDAVLLIERDTLRIVEANSAAEALSGYSRQELANIVPASVIRGDLFDRRSALLAQLNAGSRPEIDTQLRTRGGREIPVAVGLSAFEQGATRYLLLIARDISERQKAAQRLAQNEKLAGMGRLATSIAHEINNPLQAIHNSLHLVVNRPLSEEKRDRYLSMAHEEVDRLITLVQRMLDFYRPSRDGMRPISLHAILENVLSMVAEQLREADIVVERGWDERLPWVKGIGIHLKHVFLNLALNAVEAMPDGGRLTVRTRVEVGYPGLAERYVLVEFIDTGPGIPDHEAQTIFEPFYTTKHKGPGLGLAISYSIVERHEGTLSVSSGSGGTTFRVALPAIDSSEVVSG